MGGVAGRGRRRGYCAPSGWSTGGVEGQGGEPQRGLHSVWLLTRKYPAQDKPEGREPGLGRCGGTGEAHHALKEG